MANTSPMNYNLFEEQYLSLSHIFNSIHSQYTKVSFHMIKISLFVANSKIKAFSSYVFFSGGKTRNSSSFEANWWFNPSSANFTKWSNTLKQFVAKLPTNCLSVFDHFVGLVLKGLTKFCKLIWLSFAN